MVTQTETQDSQIEPIRGVQQSGHLVVPPDTDPVHEPPPDSVEHEPEINCIQSPENLIDNINMSPKVDSEETGLYFDMYPISDDETGLLLDSQTVNPTTEYSTDLINGNLTHNTLSFQPTSDEIDLLRNIQTTYPTAEYSSYLIDSNQTNDTLSFQPTSDYNVTHLDNQEPSSVVVDNFNSWTETSWSTNNSCDNLSQDTVNTNSSDLYDNTEYMDTVSSIDSSRYLISVSSDENEALSPYNSFKVIDAPSATGPIDNDVKANVESKFEVLTTIDQITIDSIPKPLKNKANSTWHLETQSLKTPLAGKGFYEQLIRSVPNISKFGSYKHLGALSSKEEHCSRPLLYSGVGAIEQYDPSVPNEGEENLKNIFTTESVIIGDNHMKSLLAISIALAFTNIGIGSVRSLQSSINQEGGVGMAALTCSCVMFMVVSLFSSLIVQYIQPKKCFLYGLIPQLFYIICNIYPNVWLMVITSGLQGMSLAILWNAMSTYVTFLARGQSAKHAEEFESVSCKYFGITCFFWQSSMIFGNLIASFVLMYGKTAVIGTNSSAIDISFPQVIGGVIINNNSETFLNSNQSSNLHMCGSAHCHYSDLPTTDASVNDFTIYLLFSVYSSFVVMALIVTAIFLKPINSKFLCQAAFSCNIVGCRMKSVFIFVVKPQFLLLVPLFLYSTMEMGFATADIVMAFVTCPLGIHMVGYTMICLGVCASLGSYLSGSLNKLLGRTTLLCFAAAVNLSLLVLMSTWTPTTDSLYVYFILMGGWGLADGIWMSQTTSLVGVLFPDHYEEGYTGLRIFQGLGATISYSYAPSLCMMTKIYIMLSVCIIGMVGYFLSELYRKRISSHVKDVKIIPI